MHNTTACITRQRAQQGSVHNTTACTRVCTLTLGARACRAQSATDCESPFSTLSAHGTRAPITMSPVRTARPGFKSPLGGGPPAPGGERVGGWGKSLTRQVRVTGGEGAAHGAASRPAATVPGELDKAAKSSAARRVMSAQQPSRPVDGATPAWTPAWFGVRRAQSRQRRQYTGQRQNWWGDRSSVRPLPFSWHTQGTQSRQRLENARTGQ